MTIADDVLQDMAYDVKVLEERIVSVEEDREIYRLLAVAALARLQDLTVKHARLRDDRDRLRDELRAWREQQSLQAGR